MAESTLITSRRNFLVRALGFTAAGATVTVPIVAVASARERVAFHARALEHAFRDYFPGYHVMMQGNGHTPEQVVEYGFPAVLSLSAHLTNPHDPEDPNRDRDYCSWRT